MKSTNMRTSKEPLLSHEVPELPFQKVASDILEYNGISYVVVDYLTKWLEIVPLQSKKSPGVPDVVVSDNMPYSSYECRQFAKNFGFEFKQADRIMRDLMGWQRDSCKRQKIFYASQMIGR